MRKNIEIKDCRFQRYNNPWIRSLRIWINTGILTRDVMAGFTQTSLRIVDTSAEAGR